MLKKIYLGRETENRVEGEGEKVALKEGNTDVREKERREEARQAKLIDKQTNRQKNR